MRLLFQSLLENQPCDNYSRKKAQVKILRSKMMNLNMFERYSFKGLLDQLISVHNNSLKKLFKELLPRVNQYISFVYLTVRKEVSIDWIEQDLTDHLLKKHSKMRNIKHLFHLISYLQYPFLIITFFYLLMPYYDIFILNDRTTLFSNFNTALIFSGIGISFSTLQDTTKVQNSFSKNIWENKKKGKKGDD